MRFDIPLYKPFLGPLERERLLEAFDSGWISSRGKYVSEFEEAFAKRIGRKHALSVCNGTCALHVALEALELRKNTVVLCPSLTYVSSANAIRYAGLIPLFVDCDEDGVSQVEHFAEGADFCSKNGFALSAIMPVHLYGNMADVDEIRRSFRNVKIVEDAAESFGSYLRNKTCGSHDSEFACFSFFGNKTITTGEGGMVACNDDDLYMRTKLLRGVGQDPNASQRYNHVVVGYNYRMTNLAAAIGTAQLQNANDILAKKRIIADRYKEHLENQVHFLQPSDPDCISNNWLVTIGVKNNNMREGLMLYLDSNRIETRPAFLPMHTMVALGGLKVNELPNSEKIGSNYLNLPSYPELTVGQVDEVCHKIQYFLNSMR